MVSIRTSLRQEWLAGTFGEIKIKPGPQSNPFYLIKLLLILAGMDNSFLVGIIVTVLAGFALSFACILIWGAQWWSIVVVALPVTLLFLFGEWLYRWLEQIHDQDRPPSK